MSIVKEIIDEWDPIDLLPFAPSDEYEDEIKKIEQLVENGCDLNKLSEGIYQVFLVAFGDDVFLKNKDECIKIAKAILDKKSVERNE